MPKIKNIFYVLKSDLWQEERRENQINYAVHPKIIQLEINVQRENKSDESSVEEKSHQLIKYSSNL